MSSETSNNKPTTVAENPTAQEELQEISKNAHVEEKHEYKVTREPVGPPVKPDYSSDPSKMSEQTAASWYQWPLFSWVSPLLDRGTARTEKGEPLMAEDLLKLPAHEDPTYNYHRIRFLWNEELKKQEEDPEYKPNLAGVLWQTYRYRILVGTTYRFISDGCAFGVPFLLRYYTEWLTDAPEEDKWKGWLWLFAMVIGNTLMALTLQACMQHTLTAFNEMRNGLRLLIFDAILRYPASHEETGKIMAAHTQDTQALLELAIFVHGAVVGIPLLLGGAVALWFFIGYAGLAVIGIVILSTPLQGVVMGKVFSLRGPFIKAGAKRVNLLSELLQGIRISKYMCWEDNFVSKISDFRATELVFFESMQRWRIPMMLVMMALPIIINFSAFALQYAIEGSVRVATAFAALTMLNALRIPIMMIPMSVSKILDTKIAMDRVSEVCAYRGFYEYAQRLTDKDDNNDNAIIMENISVIGDKKKKNEKNKQQQESSKTETKTTTNNEPTSTDDAPSSSAATNNVDDNDDDNSQIIAKKLSITIPSKKLCGIFGATASGKSVLVRALLGEADVKKDEGTLKQFGTIAYCPQESWISNQTIRKNITMNNDFDEEWYQRVCDECQLLPDFETFASKDFTEIGERGINLSGGTKARISLARAMYSRRSIVIADDPLSAVDPHVSAALFDNLFSNDGSMSERTRILVTHQTRLASNCDFIIVMKGNQIAFQGNYQELKASGLYDALTEAEEEEEREKEDARKKKAAAKAAGKVSSPSNPSSPNTAQQPQAPCPPDENAPTKEEISSEKERKQKEDIEKGKLMVTEVNQSGEVSWDVYFWYLKLGEYLSFAGVIFFAFVAAGFFVLSNFVLAFWSSKDSVPGLGVWSNEDYMLAMGVCALLGSIFLIVRQWVFVTFITNVATKAHESMMARIVRAPTAFFDTVPMGRVLTRFQKDVQAMDFMVSEQLQFAINQIFLVLGALITVFISAPYVMVLLPFLIVIFLYLYKKYSNTVRGLKRLDGSATSPVSAIVNEAVGGLASIRTYEIADSLYEEHERRTGDSAAPQMNIRVCQRWLATRSDVLGNVILFFVGLFGVISRYGDQSSWLPLTPSLIALALASTIQATNALTQLTRSLSELSTEMASTERINEFATKLPQEPDYDYESEENETAPGPSWPTSTEIKFEDASMRYRPGLPLVLKNLNFTIKKNCRTSIVGRTGSGKSSMLIALFRIAELASGRILLDNRDISKLKMHDLRKNLIMIPQDPLLFSGTVRANLDPFSQHSDEAIWKVLDKLQMRERLTTFITDENEPKGLSAVLKEKGSNLSVGERQKLCLCRAILKKIAPGASKNMVVCLDEASASLDSVSDALLQSTIREEFQSDDEHSYTTIVIAHRLATIIDSDYIIVLDQGRVAEYDTPLNLISKDENDEGAIFRGMVSKLGKQQFELLRSIAAGEKSYAESLQIDTSIEDK